MFYHRRRRILCYLNEASCVFWNSLALSPNGDLIWCREFQVYQPGITRLSLCLLGMYLVTTSLCVTCPVTRVTQPPVLVLRLPGHAPLRQYVGQLGVVGEVRPVRVGELSVILTETRLKQTVRRLDLYSLVVVFSKSSSLWPPAMTLLVVQGCLTGSGVLAWKTGSLITSSMF